MAGWSTPPAPPVGLATAVLLQDGTVLCFEAGFDTGLGTRVFQLRPDASGSYVNGTWQEKARMTTGRLYFGAHTLGDGRVFASGGEYSTDSPAFTDLAEVYFPWTDGWTNLGHLGISEGDAPTCTLPNGEVLIVDLNNGTTGQPNKIYSEASGVRDAAPNPIGGLDEGATILLQNDVLLAVGFIGHGTKAARYFYTADAWNTTSDLPLDIVNSQDGEIGPAVGLYDGRVFVVGGFGNNVMYDYNADSWSQVADSPILPNGKQGAGNDNPAAVLPDGRVLVALAGVPESGNNFPADTYFYIYDPGANTFTQIPSPSGTGIGAPSFIYTMLMLPTGQVLLFTQGQPYIYTPDGSPSSAWRPIIDSFTPLGGNDYQLDGRQLCGLTEGGYQGDDWSLSTNMPVCYLDDGAGNIYWCNTTNPSTRSIGVGTPGTATVTFPPALPPVTYNLYVVANGIASDPWPVDGSVVLRTTEFLGMVPF